MSAIAGICHWDRQPVAPEMAAALGAQNRIHGSDVSSSLSRHPWLVLQSHMVHFDHLATLERQPLLLAGGSVLTWDGRLDNRDDLLIRLHHDVGSDHTDAALVAAAFARWGVDALPLLIGDWSLALWDEAEQRMILARDYAGGRPLFYLQRPGTLAWSTSLDGITQSFGLTTPNEVFIAQSYSGIRRPDITPYPEVSQVRSGHSLICTATAVASPTRYWTFPAEPVTHSKPHDYIDHLRDLLVESVRVRLRSSRPVWSHLSGGLDSSSIVCIAHRLIDSRTVEAPQLRPVTWDTGGSEVGEAERVVAVERWCGLATTRTTFVRYHPASAMLADGERWRPVNWRVPQHEPEMVAAGDRVLLTGGGGDLIMMNGPQTKLEFLDLIARGRFLEFVRVYAEVSKRVKAPILSLLRRTIRDLRQAEWKMHSTRPRGPMPSHIFQGLTPDMWLRVPAQLRYGSLVRDFSRIRRPLALSFYEEMEGNRNETLTPVLPTQPYMHRPLTEYMLAVPPMTLVTHTTNRAGMKAALAEILPKDILSRIDKTIYISAADRFQARRAEDLTDHKHLLPPVEQWELVRRGYVEPAFLSHSLAASDDHHSPTIEFAMKSIELEMWLRSLNTRAHSARAYQDDAKPKADTLKVTTQPSLS